MIAVEPTLTHFAQRLREEWGAERVLIFGSRARGNARPDSDYDIIIVSTRFAGIAPTERAHGIQELFYDVGGHGPMDLFCVTPDEFARARQRITLIAAVMPEAIDLLPAHVSASP